MPHATIEGVLDRRIHGVHVEVLEEDKDLLHHLVHEVKAKRNVVLVQKPSTIASIELILVLHLCH